MNSEYTQSNLAILFVHDEQITLTSLSEQIRSDLGKRLSYETSLDAEKVLDQLCKKGIKTIVIISDWLMPTMKGDELLVRIYKCFLDTVKLMLTRKADSKAIERVKQEARLYSYLQKPCRDERLQVL